MLWAADMGPDENRRLFELFPDYERWWLEVYGRSVELQAPRGGVKSPGGTSPYSQLICCSPSTNS